LGRTPWALKLPTRNTKSAIADTLARRQAPATSLAARNARRRTIPCPGQPLMQFYNSVWSASHGPRQRDVGADVAASSLAGWARKFARMSLTYINVRIERTGYGFLIGPAGCPRFGNGVTHDGNPARIAYPPQRVCHGRELDPPHARRRGGDARLCPQLGQDEEAWGVIGLLHDFDYQRWPNPPDHPLQGSAILRTRGYTEEVIYAICSHADYLPDYPRTHLVDKALYACDELTGLIFAAALVRPNGVTDLTASSVKKKMKSKGFARNVNRDDIARGAADFQVELGEHIQFIIEALKPHAAALGLERGLAEAEG